MKANPCQSTAIPKSDAVFDLCSTGFLDAAKILGFKYDIEPTIVELLETTTNLWRKSGECHHNLHTLGTATTAFRRDLRHGRAGNADGSIPAPKPTEPLVLDENSLASNLDDLYGSLIRQIKTHSLYTTSDGKAFGIEPGPNTPAGYEHEIPAVDYECPAGIPRVIWAKTLNDALLSNYREPGETDWRNAGTALHSPGILGIPVKNRPREVEIISRHIKGNQQVGLWTESRKLIITPTPYQCKAVAGPNHNKGE
jgi:hypothetical protein